MDRNDSDFPQLNRRRLLQTSAAAALGWAFAPLASARPTAGAAKPTPVQPKAGPTAQPAQPSGRPKATQLKPAPILQPNSWSLSAEEKALGEVIAQRVKHAIVAAAANPGTQFPKGSYARIAQRFVRSLPEAKRGAAKALARGMLAAPLPDRKAKFGPMATSAAAAHKKQLAPLPAKAVADAQRTFKAKLRASPVKPKTFTKIPDLYNMVTFNLNEVRCVEETDEAGSDEIVMGAILVGPDGKTVRSKPITISNDFDEGEEKLYYPATHKKFRANDPNRGRRLIGFVLDKDHPFPANYTLVLTMTERDDGGFAVMLDRMWTEVAAEAKLAMMGNAHALLGPIGVAIAELVHFIIGGLIDFMASLFNNPDDYVDTVQGTLTLNSYEKSYFEGLSGRQASAPSNIWASAKQRIEFKGDGGHYKAKIHWRVGKVDASMLSGLFAKGPR